MWKTGTESISSGKKFYEAHLGGLDGIDLDFAAQNSYEHVCPINGCCMLPFLLDISQGETRGCGALDRLTLNVAPCLP